MFIIFDISLLANHMLVSGLETCSVGTSNWRATEGMICISRGPAARGDVGREPRFMVGDGAHQAPVVALFFADVANDIVISRDHIVALTEQRIAEIGRIVVQQHVVRHGCAELGVKAVKSRQDC